jgi:RimJ/RimL family protein N-acetyltransferase
MPLSAEQTIDGRRYAARTVTPETLRDAAPILAHAYGHPFNAAMMGHDEPFTEGEVIEHVEELVAEGGHAFLLTLDGVVVGDADLRGLDASSRTAELAIMLVPAAPDGESAQRRGLGTRFALLVHALAFRALGLERVFVAILPHNEGSQRLFAKLGYVPDDSPAARALVDDAAEVTLSIDRARFEALHAAALEGARIG